MNLFHNMLAAAVLGAFLLACLGILTFTFISFWPECRAMRLRHVVRFLAGAAICGLVGALFMQAFDLWLA